MKKIQFSAVPFTDMILDRIQAGAQQVLQIGIIFVLIACFASLLSVMTIAASSLF